MTFNIGDEVVPVVDIQVNDVTISSAGQSGTVISREITGIDTVTSGDLYDYQVQYYVPIVVHEFDEEGSLENTTVVGNSWFTEEDLGGEGQGTGVSIDLASIGNTFSQATVSSATAVSEISNITSQVAEDNVFYDSLSSFLDIAVASNDSLAENTIPSDSELESDPSLSVNARTTEQASQTIALNNVILQESAENLIAKHDILLETQTALKTESDLAQEQIRLGALDDELNAKTYQDNILLINNANQQSVLTPSQLESIYQQDPIENQTEEESVDLTEFFETD